MKRSRLVQNVQDRKSWRSLGTTSSLQFSLDPSILILVTNLADSITNSAAVIHTSNLKLERTRIGSISKECSHGNRGATQQTHTYTQSKPLCSHQIRDLPSSVTTLALTEWLQARLEAEYKGTCLLLASKNTQPAIFVGSSYQLVHHFKIGLGKTLLPLIYSNLTIY